LNQSSGKTVSTGAPKGTRNGSSATVQSSCCAVFLVGFMGAGKTSVGRALGQRLNWIFEDLDDRIELRERRSVAEIFRDSGESAFRRAEHDALRALLEELRTDNPRIIALGGGAFVQDDNAALLLASALPSVFLDAPVDELWQRCCTQAGGENPVERPLLRDRERFRELHETRSKRYAQASITIQTGGRQVEDIAAEIAETLGLNRSAIRSS
jgi:shikimate kinase